ncbi:hypothetical protein ES705_43713 [subsurface metagenome]
MFPTIKTYYEQVKRNSEFDDFSKKLKKNIEKLVVMNKKILLGRRGRHKF